MAIIEGSSGGLQVDLTHNAARMSMRPGKLYGSFSLSHESGALAGAAANSVIAAFRWGDASYYALIRKLRLEVQVTTAFTTAQELSFDAVIGRSYSASHTGGTGATMTGNNAKRSTGHGTSRIATNGDIRIATTAALAGGTVTADTQGVLNTTGYSDVVNAAAGTKYLLAKQPGIVYDVYPGDYPILLGQNEGILIRPKVALGAGGVIRVNLSWEWDEVAIGDYSNA